jgi:hypothetical protein
MCSTVGRLFGQLLSEGREVFIIYFLKGRFATHCFKLLGIINDRLTLYGITTVLWIQIRNIGAFDWI